MHGYGIMLLQMVEARANVEVKLVDQWSEGFFLERIYKQVLVRNEKVYGVMREEEEEGVRKMLMVGFWCIQTAPADRPSMKIRYSDSAIAISALFLVTTIIVFISWFCRNAKSSTGGQLLLRIFCVPSHFLLVFFKFYV